ncbi:autotransporter outer membrane beta-barrel domain-containing protein [Microvirga sp. W0021]|uniref:Autotransporter outer membrane beta-barrel domain-containing protein n=1 Tax=Hohaiivirga grylli TaxID=3133970 RepID=A0ABV0BPY5_9HYPH
MNMVKPEKVHSSARFFDSRGKLAISTTALATYLLCGMAMPASAQQYVCNGVTTALTDAQSCASTGNVTASVDNITITANGATFLYVRSSDADATLTVNNTNLTTDGSSHGYYVVANGTVGDTSLYLTGTNNIVLGTSKDTAVLVSNSSGTAPTGDLLLNVTGTLNITNNGAISNVEMDGMEISNGGSGNAYLSHTGNGIIQTYRGSAVLLKLTATSSGNGTILLGKDVRLKVDNTGTTNGNNSGIRASALSTGNIDINSAATIDTTGTGSHGIYATSTIAGGGKLNILNTGNITVSGDSSHNIRATTVDGNVTIEAHGVLINNGQSTGNSAGVRNSGINAESSGAGNILIKGDATISLTSEDGPNLSAGITAYSYQSGNVDVIYSGNISSQSKYDSSGIRVHAVDGSTNIEYTGGTIHVKGDNGDALYASAFGAGAASVTAKNSTLITEANNGQGGSAFAIAASTNFSDATVTVINSTLEVDGASYAIFAHGNYQALSGGGIGKVTVDVDSGSTLTSNGSSGGGIRAINTTGAIDIVHNGTTTVYGGGVGAGISATGTGQIEIANGGTIHGGWANLQANNAAVIMDGGEQTLSNTGTLDALADRAVRSTAANTFSLDNSGTMIGTVNVLQNAAAAPATVNFANSGTWDMRSFADTDGDLVRDSYAVAVSNLGESGINTVTNTGTIRVLGDEGLAATVDTANMYLPEANGFNTVATGGPAQAHILGVADFTNNGIIDLTANGVAGDVLVISGGQTAGVNGNGNFVTGGSLNINTVLNEGGANSQSDVLVVDNVVNSGSATVVNVTATGNGAETIGNGILVVDVLGTRSDADAFVLGNRVVGGLYEYGLKQAGSNWYLQNDGLRDEVVVTTETPRSIIELGSSMIASASVRASSMTFRGPYNLYGGFSPYSSCWNADPEDKLKRKSGKKDLNDWCHRVEENQKGHFNSVWARAFGATGKQGSYNYDKNGARTNWSQQGMQVGVDLYGVERKDGSGDILGVYFSYGRNDTNVKNVNGKFGQIGSVDFQAYSVGAYWTHLSASGWYVDTVLQGTIYDLDQSVTRGRQASTNGYGFAASLEGGYKFDLGNGFVLEPQAQAIWQFISLDSFNDGYGITAMDDINDFRARIGAKLGYTFKGETPITVWGLANIWKDFSSKSSTAFYNYNGSLQGIVKAPLDDSWFELGLGVSGQITKDLSLTAEGSYNQGLNNSDRTSWQGSIGVRYTW